MAKLINIYRDKFTVVPNEVNFDKRLDFRTRGVLCTILALPDGWQFSLDGLSDLVNGSDRGEGKDAIRKAVSHLEALGYLKRIHVKAPNGKFTGYDYQINIPPIPY